MTNETKLAEAKSRVIVDRPLKGKNLLTGKNIFGAAKWYVLDDNGDWKRNKRAAEKILKELGFTLFSFEKTLNAKTAGKKNTEVKAEETAEEKIETATDLGGYKMINFNRIETKIAKNGTLILKANGKRSNQHDVCENLRLYAVGSTITNDKGHTFTCLSKDAPTTPAFCFSKGYLFSDEAGNQYLFDTACEALNRIAHEIFEERNIVKTQPEEKIEETAAEEIVEVEAQTEVKAEEIVEVETEVEPALDFNAEPEGTAPNAKKFIKAALDTEPERYQQVATARKEVVASPVEATAMTKLDTLKEKRAILRRAFFSALKDHYVKHNDEFFDAAESGYTTFGVGDHTLFYRKDGGKFIKVDDKAFDALNRLEIKLDIAEDAVNAEIAKTQFKFEAGKYYVNDEGNKFFCIKRNKKTVKFFDCAFTQDDGFMDLDADEDDDWERKVFKCKIQFDERGEFVDWYEGDPDDDGDRDLITILAKNVTDPPETEHDPEHEDEDDKPGTESKPDDFTAELLKLKSEQSAAKKILDIKQAELIKVQNEHQAAQDAWNKTNRAVENLYRAKAEELSAKLLPLRKNVLAVKTQDGFTPYIALDTVTISLDKGKFAIHGDCSEKLFFELARYDTPAQVEAAINGLKATDALGGDKFTFPANEELNASTADKFKSAVKTEIKAAQKIVRTKRAKLILARVNGESTEQAEHELDLAYLRFRGLENLIANSEEVIA